METGKLLLSKFTLDIVIQICTNGTSNGCVIFYPKYRVEETILKQGVDLNHIFN